MSFVYVDWTVENGLLLADGLAEDHDLLEEEHRERLHLHGGPVAAAAASAAATAAAGGRLLRVEVVQADEGTAVQELPLGRDLALLKQYSET